MIRRLLCAAVVLGISACSLPSRHPGWRVAARKCTPCHTQPTRKAVRAEGFEQVLKRHSEQLELSKEEAAQLQGWAAEPTPGSRGRDVEE